MKARIGLRTDVKGACGRSQLALFLDQTSFQAFAFDNLRFQTELAFRVDPHRFV